VKKENSQRLRLIVGGRILLSPLTRKVLLRCSTKGKERGGGRCQNKVTSTAAKHLGLKTSCKRVVRVGKGGHCKFAKEGKWSAAWGT